MRASGTNRGRQKSADATHGFWTDLLDVKSRYGKRTSADHKRLVLLLVLAGAALRAWMMTYPVTYEEALAFVRYSSAPLAGTLGDYSTPENHVLYSLLAKWSAALFGVNLVTLRLPAFLAGVLLLPLYYLVVRALFNRYIAVIALALAAGSGALIEYSALGRGFSISWICLLAAMALARHFLQHNDRTSAILMGVLLALGTWSVPTLLPGVVLVHVWAFFTIAIRHAGSLGKRYINLSLSVVAWVVVVAVVYGPILRAYGASQLFHHASLPAADRKLFAAKHPEAAYELWSYLVATASEWFAWAGIMCMLFAAYVSARYRLMLFALAMGAIPLVILRAHVAAPRDWLYTLLFFHLGMAVGVFYALKAVHDHLKPQWGKRGRTLAASLILLAYGTWCAMAVLPERQRRYPEARSVAVYLKGAMEPGDRAIVVQPWDVPIEFHAREMRLDRSQLNGAPEPGAMLYVAVCSADGQSMASVLKQHRINAEDLPPMEMVMESGGMEIFAARLPGPVSQE